MNNFIRNYRKILKILQQVEPKMNFLNQICKLKLSENDYYIVDSMPLEACKLSRSSRSSICKEEYETAPKKGIKRKCFM